MTDYEQHFSRAGAHLQESAIRKMGAVGARIPDLVSFAAGSPAPDLFPWTALREITDRLLESREPGVLQYGGTRGYRPLIESLVEVMATRGVRASVDDTIVTTGSQQGIDLVGRILVDPGDVLLVELPAYAGAITAFRNIGARLVGVRQEADGVDIDHLDRVVQRERSERRRVAALYVTPNFQNPTGLLMSQPKRRLLLDWAARRDVLLIEDDPYGAIYFDEETGPSDTRPIKAGDEEGRVVYLSSFSKTLAPGLRVAWLVAPVAIAGKIETVKQAADLCTGVLDQRIVHEALTTGIVTSGLPELRRRYREKCDVMERALGQELGPLIAWPHPRGGFFLWATLPEGFDADRFLTRALAAKVSYVTGSAFFVDEFDPRLVRLSFSAPAVERIEEGVRRLASAIRDEMAVMSTSSL
jgi:2-aminoadipate transaminase